MNFTSNQFIQNKWRVIGLMILSISLFLAVTSAESEEDRPCPKCEPMWDQQHWEWEHVHHNNSKRSRNFDKRATAALAWKGGPIMPRAKTASIFWGLKWVNPSFVSDKISSIDTFFLGANNSKYFAVDNEYTGSNGRVASTDLKYTGHYVDITPATTTLSLGNVLFYAVRDTVCRNVKNPDPSGMGFYPVFVDIPRPSGAGYCAWHSYDYCKGVRIQFAFFWNLDGDAGCDPRDNSGLRSQGAAAICNVAAHEFNEARTDPLINAWMDASGYEGADKCSWKYPSGSMTTLSNGAKFKLQLEWSNNAFTAGTGISDGSGNKGCVSQ